MKLEDMILVIENGKGNAVHKLMTIDDYLYAYVIGTGNNKKDVARRTIDLMETKGKRDYWSDIYFVANKSIHARFCHDEAQLVQFLKEPTESENVAFHLEECSWECIRQVKRMGYGLDGKVIEHAPYQYEIQTKGYHQGDILHNFNGIDYRVLEKLTEKNLILMSINSGQFLVALGTKSYKRYPKRECPDKNNVEYGITWEHGVYLGYTPSEIDFEKLRFQYGTIQTEMPREEQGNKLKEKSR